MSSDHGPDGKGITDLDAVAPKPFVDAFFARFCAQADNKVRGYPRHKWERATRPLSPC